MWPMPRAPISRTRWRVPASARSAVMGSPISLLREPWVHTVGACRRSSWAMRSLVLVLPEEPVRAMTLVPRLGDGAGRARRAPPSRRRRRRRPVRRPAGWPARPPRPRRRPYGEVVAVDPVPGEGGEQGAGPHGPGVRHDRAGDLRVRVRYVVQPSGDDSGDLGEGEGDQDRGGGRFWSGVAPGGERGAGRGLFDGPAEHTRVVEGPYHSGDVLAQLVALARTSTVSPGSARETAETMAAARSSSISTVPRSWAGTSAAPASIVARIASGPRNGGCRRSVRRCRRAVPARNPWRAACAGRGRPRSRARRAPGPR